MNLDEFFAGTPQRAKMIGWGILLGPLGILVVLATLFLRPDPISREQVFGCHRANNAPWLKVLPSQIVIGDASARSFDYQAEPAKEGYRLSVSPALGLELQTSGKYAFQGVRGVGYFWPLLAKTSDNPKDLRNPGDFGGRFRIIARDGQAVVYERTSDIICE